jgi:hypothetical protein
MSEAQATRLRSTPTPRPMSHMLGWGGRHLKRTPALRLWVWHEDDGADWLELGCATCQRVIATARLPREPADKPGWILISLRCTNEWRTREWARHKCPGTPPAEP